MVVATRVLLVDDDSRFASVVRRVLEDDGYDVVDVIQSAEHVDAAVGEHGPDVIVLDLILDGADGLEIAEDLRAAGHRAPVVLFSSLFDQRIGRESLAAGFGYVEKAAGVEALELAIEAATGLAGVIDLREAAVRPEPAD